MNANTPSRDKLRDTTSDLTRLGLDGRGREHHWHSTSRTICVFASDARDEIVHVQRDLSDLGHWVDWVRTEFGWDDVRYDDRSMVELMNDLATGVEVQG